MVLSAKEYRYLDNWINVYLSDEISSNLTDQFDLPEHIRLQDKFTEVELSSDIRFGNIDYQDFWVCLDVQDTFYYLDNQNNNMFNDYHLVIPPYSRTPQVQNYEQYKAPSPLLGAEVIFDNGHYQDRLWTKRSYVLSADLSNTFFGNILSSKPYVLLDSDILPYFNREWEKYIDEQLSSVRLPAGNITLWDSAHLSIEPYQALRGHDLTRELISSLSVFPKDVISKENYINAYGTNNQILSFGIEPLITETLQLFPTQNFIWGCEKGPFVAHMFSKYSPTDDWYEYAIPYDRNAYYFDGGMEFVKDNGVVYCNSKYAFDPEYDNYGKFFIYANQPTFCMYGDLSADIYIEFYVHINSTSYCVFKKIPNVQFARTQYKMENWGNVNYYTLKSTTGYSVIDVLPVNVFDENVAPSQINQILTDSGKSPIDFTQNGCSLRINSESTFMVWKFSHPLVKPDGYHFVNQD